MKYLVIGAGGTGCAISAFLAKAGKDITLLARGKRLEAINAKGLTVNKKDSSFTASVKVTEECWEKKDVIFVCVKDYSLEEILPFIKRASHENTVIIPVLNIYGTGLYLKERLFTGDVLGGCIYITAEKETDSSVFMSGDIFRIVFGPYNGATEDERYIKIKNDLSESGIKAILSENIMRDTFKKFSFISPMAAACAYLDVPAKGLKQVGFGQTLFLNCTEEVCALASKMGIEGLEGTKEKNLQLINGVSDEYLCSMHKDLRAGTKTEMDGLIFYVVRKAKELKIKVPTYEKIAEKFGFRIGCDCENRVAIDGEVC